MKRNNLITILFPSLIMILISTISSHMDLKGLFIISIVALFPLSILIQGIFVVLNKANIILALLTSILTFIGVMFILMKTFEIIYIEYYTISFIIGYLGTLISLLTEQTIFETFQIFHYWKLKV